MHSKIVIKSNADNTCVRCWENSLAVMHAVEEEGITAWIDEISGIV